MVERREGAAEEEEEGAGGGEGEPRGLGRKGRKEPVLTEKETSRTEPETKEAIKKDGTRATATGGGGGRGGGLLESRTKGTDWAEKRSEGGWRVG